MAFLSQGDFSFPFDFIQYWIKHFYTWSYQTGAANLDGIIRLPSRIFYIVVFALTGNVTVGYFYIFFSLVVIFVSFYLFALRVLEIQSRAIRIISALFFALNPIFLGYIAKVGLMVGAAMLPLCFVVIDLAFEKKQFRYFVLYILLLNISFIHPFTLTINLLASGIYLIWRAKKQGKFLWQYKFKTIGVLLLGLALNAYFILPIMSMGAISKTALSQEISYAPVDYASLIDFANAGNPLTALSLSRDVLLDFRYYSFMYEPIYFGAVFIFYLVLFGLYVYNERQLTKRDRARVVLLLSAFLILLLLSMAMFFDVNKLLKLVVALPGGWMFRSPLKWQLYIPFVLAALLALLLQRTPSAKIRRTACLVSVGVLVLMSLFLGVEIFRKLLVPRDFHYLSQLQRQDLNQKNFLFVSDNACFSFLQENLGIVTEMNQIFISHNVQLKRIQAADLDTVDLGSYDYILGCTPTLAFPLKTDNRFKQIDSFVEAKISLYQNQQARPYIYATDRVLRLSQTENLADKYAFATSHQWPFDFTGKSELPATTGLHDPFEALGLDNLQGDNVVTKPQLESSHAKQLWLTSNEPLYYQIADNEVLVSSQPQPEYTQFNGTPVDLAAGHDWQFAYQDPGADRHNLIPNPSFEEGLWQKEVGDCYAYDDKPNIGMRLNTHQASDGKQSLELNAQAHIACTGPGDLPIQEGSRYLLQFRYQNAPKSYGSIRITFDDPDQTALGDSLLKRDGGWQTYRREISVPPGAHTIKLTVSAYPGTGGVQGQSQFDDFHLVQIPDLQGDLYLTEQPDQINKAPQKIDYSSNNPTKKQVHIEHATQPFFLAMRDTYHPLWRTTLAGSGRIINDTNHQKINGFMNAWYIDPGQLCQDKPAGCTVNDDGSYTLDLRIVFTPQHWFYSGLIVSGIALAGVVYYFSYLGIKRYYTGGKRYWRNKH